MRMNYKQVKRLFDYVCGRILGSGIPESDKPKGNFKAYFSLPIVANEAKGYASSFDLSVERISDAGRFIKSAIEVKLNEYRGKSEAAIVALKFRRSDGLAKIDYMLDQITAAYLTPAEERGR